MSIFDKLKSTAQQAATSAIQSIGNKREKFTFASLPESLAEMQALPEASLDTPFKTAALTVLALCAYAADKNIGLEMLNWLRGPRPLNGQEISFLNDRFRDGKTYLPFTYFVGATPDNNYTPSQPYTIIIESNHVSGEEKDYMKLFIPCGGADDPRPIKMRQRGSDGKWFLWEQYLLTGVRTPKSETPGHNPPSGSTIKRPTERRNHNEHYRKMESQGAALPHPQRYGDLHTGKSAGWCSR